MNFDKSEVFFSANLSESTKDLIRNKLGFRGVVGHSKYLGLSVVFGR